MSVQNRILRMRKEEKSSDIIFFSVPQAIHSAANWTPSEDTWLNLQPSSSSETMRVQNRILRMRKEENPPISFSSRCLKQLILPLPGHRRSGTSFWRFPILCVACAPVCVAILKYRTSGVSGLAAPVLHSGRHFGFRRTCALPPNHRDWAWSLPVPPAEKDIDFFYHYYNTGMTSWCTFEAYRGKKGGNGKDISPAEYLLIVGKEDDLSSVGRKRQEYIFEWVKGCKSGFGIICISLFLSSPWRRSQKEFSATFRRKKTEDGFLMTHRVTSPKNLGRRQEVAKTKVSFFSYLSEKGVPLRSCFLRPEMRKCFPKGEVEIRSPGTVTGARRKHLRDTYLKSQTSPFGNTGA
ncbi:unnamed protein product [Larinioides sclopetarius]|uniref:Uncharacterized protein n=1 Tax=Larinioides sclopetarius TaxID=280406 RepID=A0AAV2AUW1_9ARAC